MKRARPLLLLAAGFLLALAPASAQSMRRGALGVAAVERLAQLGARAEGVVVDALANDARPGGPFAQRVSGPFALHGASVEAMCTDIVEHWAPLFGAGQDTVFGPPVVMTRAPGGGARSVRLAQLVRGVPLAGHGLIVRLTDDGQAAGLHGVLAARTEGTPAPGITAAQAEDVALAELAARGMPAPALRGVRRTVAAARVLHGSPELLWATHVVVAKTLVPWVVETSARNGAVVRIFANIESAPGTGDFHVQGQSVPFATGKGKGSAYTSLKNALASKPSATSLADVAMQTVVQGLAEDGFLFGRFAQVFGWIPPDDLEVFVDEQHDFSVATDDLPSPDSQSFDQVNTYAWITRSATWLDSLFGPLGTDYALPVIVNFAGLLNAFYTPDDLGLGHGPGGFVFGDVSGQTGSAMDDLSRDPTVVTHEYVHAVVDKAGLAFGNSDVDTPPRAVNEALADYFSASFHKTPCIGPVLAKFLGLNLGLDGPCLRDLSEARLLPEDLFAVTGGGGLPEEHEAGVIFGATLWRMRTALKQKAADAAIADSLPDWPMSMFEVGFDDVTVGNAEAAYAAYYGNCLWAVLDELEFTGGSKLAGKALGAAMANGAVGLPEFAGDWIADLEAGGKLAWSSEFLGLIDSHAVGMLLTQGQTLSVSVKGIAGTTVDFALFGDPGGLIEQSGKVVNAAGTSATEKDIFVAASDYYVIVVGNRVGFGGSYKATLTVKN